MPKKNYAINKAIQAMDSHDFMSIFLDTTRTFKSKKLVLEVLKRLKDEFCENKVKKFFVEINKIIKTDVEMLRKIDDKVITYIIKNIAIKKCFVDDVNKLIDNAKCKIVYVLDEKDMEFFTSNVYNYCIYKNISGNYDFDISFSEKTIDTESVKILSEFLVSMTLQNIHYQEFVGYITNHTSKNLKNEYLCLLHEKDQVLFTTFVEMSKEGDNMSYTNNVSQVVEYVPQFAKRYTNDDFTRAETENLSDKNYINLYKTSLCSKYSINGTCSICHRKQQTCCMLDFDKIDDLLAINIYTLDDLDDIYHILQHNTGLRTLTNFENTIKMSYHLNSLMVYRLFEFFECNENNDIYEMLKDLISFMMNKQDKKNTITTFNIINNIKSLDKIFSSVYKYLHGLYFDTTSRYLKIQIRHFFKSKTEYIYRYDEAFFEFVFDQAEAHESLDAALTDTLELFDLQYDDYVTTALFPISKYIYENGLLHLLDENKSLMAQTFILFDLIKNNQLAFDNYFGVDMADLRKKHATKLLTLALLFNTNLEVFTDVLIINDISNFFQNNFIPVILTVKNFFLYYKLNCECCIYQVLKKILDITRPNNRCFNLKASSYIMYFISEKTNEVDAYCIALKHTVDRCKNELFQMISNFSCKDNKKRNIIPKINQTDKTIDFVDCWYVKSMDLLLQDEKIYFFTIGKLIEEFENLLENMKAYRAIEQKISLHQSKLKNDFLFLNLIKHNSFNFRSKFTTVYGKFFQKYSRFKEAYNFIGRTGLLSLTNMHKIERIRFIVDKKVSLPSVIVCCIEYIYDHFDIENQETYYFVMQQLIKKVSDVKIKSKIDNDFLEHLKTSNYVYDGDIDGAVSSDTRTRNIDVIFVDTLFDYALSIMQENLDDYYQCIKYGHLLDHKIKAYMLGYMFYVLRDYGIDTNIVEHINHDNIQKENKRSLRLILKLDSFCQNRLLEQNLSIKIALFLKDYYYMIRIYENMYRNGTRNENILCALYILISDFGKCKMLNMQTKLISSINIFFDLCLDHELTGAKACLSSIYCSEIESTLYNRILEKIETEETNIDEICKVSNNLTKQYSAWNTIDDEQKTCNLYLVHDARLLTDHVEIAETPKLLAMRHDLSSWKYKLTECNIELFNTLSQNHKYTNMLKQANFQSYKDYLILDRIALFRETNNKDKCKDEITNLLLHKKYDVLYELAKYKLDTGATRDAILILEKYLYMRNVEDLVYKKTTLLHASLSQDSKIFTDAFEKYEASESLFFIYGKFLENLDPLGSLEAYLKSLTHGTKYINESFLKVLNLLCEVKDGKYPQKTYKTIAEYHKKASAMAEIYFKDISVREYKIFIGQILSKLGHQNKKTNEIIVNLVRNIILEDSFAISGWYIMFTFDKESKNLHTEMIDILKTLPSEMHIKLKEFKALIDILINISKFDAKGNKNIDIDKMLRIDRKVNFDIRVPSESWETYIQEISNEVYVYHSLQCPKRVAFLGNNGKTYFFLCKSNDDLRKDARFMDLSRIMNSILSKNKLASNENLYIRTYNVFVLKYSCGIIEWVSGLETLRNIIYPEYEKQNLIVNEELKKYRSKKKIGDKNFTEVLKRFPPVLHNFFNSIIEPKVSYLARETFTKTYAVMCIIGWFMGLGDRHLENIMIDMSTCDTFHVDLNCILNKAKKLEIPESVPFRLTQNIVDAFGIHKTEATFKSTMIKTLKAMIENEDIIMTTLQCILNDPFSEWKSKSKLSVENINKVLDEFRLKLKCEPEKMVEHLINEAEDLHNLANMYIGWCSFV